MIGLLNYGMGVNEGMMGVLLGWMCSVVLLLLLSLLCLMVQLTTPFPQAQYEDLIFFAFDV